MTIEFTEGLRDDSERTFVLWSIAGHSSQNRPATIDDLAAAGYHAASHVRAWDQQAIVTALLASPELRAAVFDESLPDAKAWRLAARLGEAAMARETVANAHLSKIAQLAEATGKLAERLIPGAGSYLELRNNAGYLLAAVSAWRVEASKDKREEFFALAEKVGAPNVTVLAGDPASGGPERVTDHGGAGGGDEDGYDMTGVDGGPTHRDVRNWAKMATIGATTTASLIRYADKQEQLEREAAGLRRELSDRNQRLNEIADERNGAHVRALDATEQRDAALTELGKLRDGCDELAKAWRSLSKQYERTSPQSDYHAASHEARMQCYGSSSEALASLLRNVAQGSASHDPALPVDKAGEAWVPKAGDRVVIVDFGPQHGDEFLVHAIGGAGAVRIKLTNGDILSLLPSDVAPAEPAPQPAANPVEPPKSWFVVEGHDGTWSQVRSEIEARELLAHASADSYVTTKHPLNAAFDPVEPPKAALSEVERPVTRGELAALLRYAHMFGKGLGYVADELEKKGGGT